MADAWMLGANYGRGASTRTQVKMAARVTVLFQHCKSGDAYAR